MTLALYFLLSALPFWRATPPAEWSDGQLEALLREAPFGSITSSKEGRRAYLANFGPMAQAEEEWLRRRMGRRALDSAAWREYQSFLQEEGKAWVVLSIDASGMDLSNANDVSEMEKYCVMKVGKRRYPLQGRFRPTLHDPWLRLLFRRDIRPDDRQLSFELVLPVQGYSSHLLLFSLDEIRKSTAP
jgi:hypothetical protein